MCYEMKIEATRKGNLHAHHRWKDTGGEYIDKAPSNLR